VTLESMAIALSQVAINWPSVVVGVVVLAAIVAGDRLLPGVPIALPALIVALIASVALGLPSRGVDVLGPIPSGLPPVRIPLLTPEQLVALLPGAVAIAILSFADTSATGRAFTKDPSEEPDANRELVALSAADLGASFTSGYPIGSSPSRTSAAIAAGSRTQLTGIIAAVAVTVVLLFLTGPMAALPIPALGAVILAAVVRMISADRIIKIWRAQRIEGAIAITAMLGVIFYGTLAGVGVAVLLASLNVFRRSAQPRIAELGLLPGSDVFADLERDPEASRVPGIIVVRFSGPLFFATASALKHRVRSLVEERPDSKTVVLDAAGIVDLDLTAADVLDQLDEELRKQGIELVVARPTGALRDLLRRFGLGRLIGADGNVRRRIIEAVTLATASGAPATAARADALSVREAEPVAAPEQPQPPRPEGAEAAAGEEGKGVEALAPPSPLRRHWTAGILVVGGVAIVAVLAIGVLTGRGDTPPVPPAGEVVVPNLVGQSLDRARIATEDRGLILGDPTFVQTTARPEDTVIGQSPGPGEIVEPGSVVIPRVSTGRELVVIPDLAGMREAEAVVAAASVGLRVAGSSRVEDEVVPAGIVLGTSPAAGLEVSSGTSITLIVSSGPPPEPSPPEPSPPPTTGPTPTAAPSSTAEPPPSLAPTPEPTPGPSTPTPAEPTATPAPT
jgi:MFS superfamily sulfate permease-like transporter